MWHKKNELMIIGMSTEIEICQIQGQLSRDSRFWAKLLQNDTCDSDSATLKNHVRITYGLTVERGSKKSLKKKREKQEWLIEESKLEYDRISKKIYSIDPSDEDYKDIIKNAGRKLETSITAALPCKREFFKVSIRKTVVSKTEKVKVSETTTWFSCIAKNRINEKKKDPWRTHLRERTQFL